MDSPTSLQKYAENLSLLQKTQNFEKICNYIMDKNVLKPYLLNFFEDNKSYDDHRFQIRFEIVGSYENVLSNGGQSLGFVGGRQPAKNPSITDVNSLIGEKTHTETFTEMASANETERVFRDEVADPFADPLKSTLAPNDDVDKVSTSSEECSSEDDTWFEANLMDECVFDLNKNSKDKLKGLNWINGYGLGWPNKEKDNYHLLVYLESGETRSDSYFCEELAKLFNDEAIKEWVDIRRPSKAAEVRFLADAEARYPNKNDGAQLKSSAQPGTSIYIRTKPEDLSNPLKPIETVLAETGGEPVMSKRGTLTAICHDTSSEPNKNYAMTCFHVGYNGQYDLNVFDVSSKKVFNDHFHSLKLEAKRPSEQQKQTEYFYKDSLDNYCQLGRYSECLFNESNDVLLISIQPDVKFQCAIEHYAGKLGNTAAKTKRKEMKKQKKKGKSRNNPDQSAVVKIGPRGIEKGVLQERSTKKDIPFEDVYVIRSTDSAQSFLQPGDSGSLVCMKDTNDKYEPFAYGVCEIDLGLEGSKRSSLCLDFKRSLNKLAEEKNVHLDHCFENCH